ncbi:MAG: SDR family oxidoreductase [Chloroflexi bacterium]|nr:SDR family oxidoreductase [Chloroflexota bacterium]
MDLGLKDKVALVAASSRGLGKAAAMELAKEGCDVVITARGEEVLYNTAEEIRQATGRNILAVKADITVLADIDRLVQTALSHFQRIDILVTNAGGPRPGTFTDMSDQDWLAALELNLMSAIRLIERVLPGMRARRWGRIINITSIAVKQPLPKLILSNTARAGLVGMAKTLSEEVAAEGITVNNVCPGYSLTDRVRDIASTRAEREGKTIQEIIDEIAADIPARRLGRPEELAALIAFLASERAAYITGTTIQSDGGFIRSLL